jgi:hypothetical protein
MFRTWLPKSFVLVLIYSLQSTLKMLNSATLETIWINKLKGAGNVCVSAHYHAQFNGANLTFGTPFSTCRSALCITLCCQCKAVFSSAPSGCSNRFLWVVLVGIGGFVIGVESFSGAQLWKTSLPGSGYEIVTLMVIDGILYAASNGAMYALTMDTGKIIWQSGMWLQYSWWQENGKLIPNKINFIDLPGLGYLSICMASSGQVTDSNSSQPFCYADDQRSE